MKKFLAALATVALASCASPPPPSVDVAFSACAKALFLTSEGVDGASPELSESNRDACLDAVDQALQEVCPEARRKTIFSCEDKALVNQLYFLETEAVYEWDPDPLMNSINQRYYSQDMNMIRINR